MNCWNVPDDSWRVMEVVRTLLEVVRKLEINGGERGSLWIVSRLVKVPDMCGVARNELGEMLFLCRLVIFLGADGSR
ncbi:hypothetical protein L873DRAFT_1810338 [Choiromyces venosus 120613-1]|uniref:Uncharacterized protein n=1 Tax=Choiromyces venosus 120613-1 TaxID=1336337 RepID=A0A3N4JII6_9PEZI|nr:hypothetical protein L873DRAFT_1810338 [Choiromyces venosus 120613-1]